MRISMCILAACVAANLSSFCDLPAVEATETPVSLVWENGITADTPAEEAIPEAETETPEVNASDEAMRVAELVNQERAAAGLSALTTDADLCRAAQVRAQELVTSFSHDRPDGSSCFTVLKECGISYVACGENIARGSQTAEAVMDGWMHSAGHKANILNSHFTKIGVAMVKSGNTCHWVQIFTA